MNLLDLVVAYAAWGDHRTGTEADRQTSEWLAASVHVLADAGG